MGVNLSAALPQLLADRGWTQDKLAEETGLRRTDVNALVKGRIEAGPGRLRKIADALEVSVLELGAPVEAADEKGKTILSLLKELEVQTTEDVVKLRKDLAAAIRRIHALEQQAQPGEQKSETQQ